VCIISIAKLGHFPTFSPLETRSRICLPLLSVI
jgi:hypothetical protein